MPSVSTARRLLLPFRPARARAAAPARPRMVASVPLPLPLPRPPELAQLTTASIPPMPAQREKVAMATVSAGPFDQLFGKRDTDLTMAYAPADGGVFNNGQSKSLGRGPTNDSFTAVYDISARRVYMPDGTI